MLPILSFNDEMNSTRVNSIDSGQIWGPASIRVLSENLPYLFLCEDVHPVFYAMAVPFLRHSIMNIYPISPAEQVGRADANRAVTVMQRAVSFWEWSIESLKNYSGYAKLPISVVRHTVATSRCPSVPIYTCVLSPWETSIKREPIKKFLNVIKVIGRVVASVSSSFCIRIGLHLRGLLDRTMLRPSLFAQRGLFYFNPT